MKILLVDDEEQILRGVSRFISCEEDGWEIETSTSGEAALKMLGTEKFDAVVSDMQMPGMDGAELLEEIRNRFPSIFRVVLSGHADQEAVLRAVKPMHQYLSKPCDPRTLIEAIKRAGIMQETIHSAEVLHALGQADCIPTFPEIVNEINREVESDTGDSHSVGEIISKDGLLSARVLQLANSSIFALNSPVSDISRAVALIGLDMIRSLAMQQAIFSKDATNEKILSSRRLFDHGFSVAVVAKLLTKKQKCSLVESNAIFSAGLLHDVGKLVLLNAFPDRYNLLLKQSNKNLEKTLPELEMESFGATHQGIGGYLFSLWGLPTEIVECVAAHHSFETCSLAEGLSRQTVFAANWIETEKDDEKLEAMVENCDDELMARKFADQIVQWREYINEVEGG